MNISGNQILAMRFTNTLNTVEWGKIWCDVKQASVYNGSSCKVGMRDTAKNVKYIF